MKYLLTFIAGAAAGALSVYLYFNKKMEKKIDEKVNEQMTTFIDRQQKMYDELINNSVQDNEKKYEEAMKSFKTYAGVSNTDKPEKSSIVELKDTEYTCYRQDADTDDDEDEDEITDEEVAELMEESRQRMAIGPHIISEDDDTCMAYDRVEYTWYPEGCILCDVYGQEVEYPEVLFGSVDWKKEITNKESITIRNPEEATDYTIYNDTFYKD